jgi:PAS domain S-box-containing protein
MHEFSPDRVRIRGEISPPEPSARPPAGTYLSIVKETMNRVGDKILKHFNATRVTLAEIEIATGNVKILSNWEAAGNVPPPSNYHVSQYYDDRMIADLYAGRLVAIDNIALDSNTAAHEAVHKDLSIRSSLHCPYLSSGEYVFKLGVHKPDPHEWTSDEKDLCRELTSSIFLRLERSRNNQKLRDSEARLRMATQAADMFVWEADLVLRKMTWADNAAKVLGCDPAILAEDFQEKWGFVHPGDQERVNREFNEAVRSAKSQFAVEYRGPERGGLSTYWLAQSFLMLDADGNPRRVVGTTQNISRQKHSELLLQESEERLRLILDSVIDHAILTTDEKGSITGWNPGAVSVFGYEPDEIIGQPIEILFTPEDRANDIPDREIKTARERGYASDERWHLKKDGSRFFASGVMSPLRGTSRGFVKVARDLTAKREAEDELRRAREELEVRVRERTKELHESNNALRQEVAERAKSEEERVALLRRIVTAQEDERGRIARDLHDQLGQRLTALRLEIASLRDACGNDRELSRRVAHLEALGERLDAEASFLAWELRPRALDDLGLVTAVENFVNEWSHHFQIAAEFHSTRVRDHRFDPEIETNLYRIAQESLNNVYKHSKATNASVILEKRGDELILVVEDNGRGFEISERNGPTPGRGLGIVGMRERAAIVGGTVEVESTVGSGTTIYVKVPAKFAADESNNGN